MSREQSSHHRAVLTGPLQCIVLALFVMSGSQAMSQQSDKPDCKCRAPGGQLRDLGTVECVDIVGKRHLVICEMSTNTPYWRKLEHTEGCPSA